MQLRVFMLGLGAALLAGTIWFTATAEDGKGFVQQASAQPPEAAKQEPAQPGTEAAPANEPGLGVDWATMASYLKQIDPSFEFTFGPYSLGAASSDGPTVMLDGPSSNVARATIMVSVWNPRLSRPTKSRYGEDNESTLRKLCLIVARLAPQWHSQDMTEWLGRNLFSVATHTTSGYEISWTVSDPLTDIELSNSPGAKAFAKLVKKGTLRIAPVGGGRQFTQGDQAEFREFYEECQAWVRNEREGPGLGLDMASLKAVLSRIDRGFTYKALGQGVTCASSPDGVQVFFVESLGNISAALVRFLRQPTKASGSKSWSKTFHQAVAALVPRWGKREAEEYSKWFDADAEMSTISISGYRLVSRFHRYRNDFLKDMYCDWVVGVASQTGRSSAMSRR